MVQKKKSVEEKYDASWRKPTLKHWVAMLLSSYDQADEARIGYHVWNRGTYKGDVIAK